jgi:hypothetical protein
MMLVCICRERKQEFEMLVEVLHFDHEQTTYEKVAEVTFDTARSVEEALEYAWRWTNNIDGSWSIQKMVFENGMFNGDYNAAVKVCKPLISHQGREYGHRSSMMGDRFIVDGVAYKVAMAGFKKVED